MNSIKANINKIIIIIVLIFLGTFIYNYINKTERGGVTEIKKEGDKVVSEMINTLTKLEKIKIDTNFFNEELGFAEGNLLSFSELKDFSEYEIPQKPVGKTNPFLDKNLQLILNLNNNNQVNNQLTDLNILDNLTNPGSNNNLSVENQ